tara:strand:- start:697 stop:1221 length:525 start_codon:yes stop_codon:yes gene_type:complete
MPEMAELLHPETYKRLIKEIGLEQTKGYKLSYLKNQTLGWIAEQRGIKTLQRAGYEIIDSKLPGNKGFDITAIKRAAGGEIKEIMIAESKYSANGRVKLARYKDADNLPFLQMDDQWIRGVTNKMGRSGNAKLRELGNLISKNEGLVKRQLNVLDASGKTKWFPNKLPKSEIFK